MKSIEEYVEQYAGIRADDPRLAYVKLLLYDFSMGAPDAGDAKAWADHFRLDRNARRIVLAGQAWMQKGTPPDAIPGFHLIGPDFVLAAESTKADGAGLYGTFLPRVGEQVRTAGR